ncbi:N-acetylneuraminate synthase family protein [Candidatus Pelagibacter sp.]|uniref:N-acetylneuraminate synthase family protein n=1 Tax=Candidatus Pelagibacter sp. TaxID=2024849 RepID=UPI003F861E16
MNSFSISNRKVSEDCTPLVVAEIGINHNGSLKEAFKLVDAAKEAGLEVIKHQTHIVEDEMSSEAKKVFPGNSPNKSIYDIMNECSLNEEDEISLKEYVEEQGMIFFSTPFSRKAVDRLEKMEVEFYKIGSGECNNYPLIEYISETKKPIILSTGMNDISSIKPAVEIIEKQQIPYALMHTTNLYPTPYNLVRLGALNDLKKNFPNAVIGLSDHTDNNLACFSAIALGASIVERHFTDNFSRGGPDISCSMDIIQAKELIKASKIIFQERGGSKNLIKEEKVTSDFAYATVVTIKKIKKGDLFSRENIWVKRPGTGEIKAEKFKSLIGKVCNSNLESDQHLKLSDIKN